MTFFSKTILAISASLISTINLAQGSNVLAKVTNSALTEEFCNAQISNWNEQVTAIPIIGASAYKFKIQDLESGISEEIISAEPSFSFDQLTIILEPNKSLNVSVAFQIDGIWKPYGAACIVKPLFVEVPCGFDPLRQQWMEKSGNSEILEEQLMAIRNYLDTVSSQDRSTYVFTIPVVFHILDDGTLHYMDADFITNDEIDDQLALLNAAFENLLTSTNPNAANVEIQFCLAQQIYTGVGSPSTNWLPYWTGYTGGESVSYGITRKQNSITNTHEIDYNPADPDGMVALNNIIGSSTFPYERYLNIWIVNSITDPVNGSSVMGYSPYPLASASPLLTPAQQGMLDGVVIQAQTFLGGSHSTANTGKTLVHEVGHYLNLYHVWTDGCHPAGNCAIQGDFMCDTPTQSAEHYNACTVPVNSCDVSEVDPTDNHMGYSGESCRVTFTNDQKAWMHAAINLYRPLLVSNPNLSLTAPDCIDPLLLTTITTSTNTQICDGGTVTFGSSPTIGGGATYSWSFPGGSPATSTSTTPSITYMTPGVYSVSLTVTLGTDVTVTRPDLVYVGDCQPLASNDGNWYYGCEVGLSFQNGMGENTTYFVTPPSPNNIKTHEAASSYSDDNGNLILYTDGNTIYNRLHDVMTGHVFGAIDGNDQNLPTMTFPTGYGSSAHRGAIVFEDPRNLTSSPAVNGYYVFHTSQLENTLNSPAVNHGLGYSYVAEGTGYATNGQVLSINNRPVQNYAISECVAAVSHCNGRDYWVLTQGTNQGLPMLDNPGPLYADQNKYYFSYLVTPSGVASAPVANLSASQPNLSIYTTFKFSPDGNIVACISRGTGAPSNYWDVFFYSFDRSTGQMSYLATFDIPLNSNLSSNYRDLEFSPDGKVLYVAVLNQLIQVDISDIYNSPVFNYSSKAINLHSLELGPDGRIYVPHFTGTNTVSVINFPNELNSSSWSNECGLNVGGIVYDDVNKKNRLSVQNKARLVDNTAGGFVAIQQNCFDFKFIPNICGRRYKWNFADLGTSTDYMPSFTFPDPGTYTVELNVDGNISYQDVVIEVPEVEITGNPFFCGSSDPSEFFASVSPPVGDYSYSWTNTGGVPTSSTNNYVSFVLTGSSGILSVTVTDLATGCTTTKELRLTDDCCESGVMADHPFKLNHDEGRTEGFDVELVPSQGLIYYAGNYGGSNWNLGTYSAPLPASGKDNFIIQLSDDNCVGWIETYPIFVATGPIPVYGMPDYIYKVRPIKVKTTSTGKIFMANKVYGHSYIAEIDPITGAQTILFELFDNGSSIYQGNIISDFEIDELNSEIIFSATITASSLLFPGVPSTPPSTAFVGKLDFFGTPISGTYLGSGDHSYISNTLSATKAIVQNNSGDFYVVIQSNLSDFKLFELSNSLAYVGLIESYSAVTEIQLTDLEYDALTDELAIIGNTQGNILSPTPPFPATSFGGFLAHINFGSTTSNIIALADKYDQGAQGIEIVSSQVYYQVADYVTSDIIYGNWVPGSVSTTTINTATSVSSSLWASAIDYDPVQSVFYANGRFAPNLDFAGTILTTGINAGMTFYAAKIDLGTGGFVALVLSDLPEEYSNTTYTIDEFNSLGESEKTSLEQLFEIYPNPTNGSFSIVFSEKITDNANLIIRDARGAIIYQVAFSQEDGIVVFDCNQLQMSKGIYTVSISTDISERHKKLIVN